MAIALLDELHKAGLKLEPFETLRSKARQAELVKRGFSKTLNSKHLIGHAVDFVYKDEKGWSWDMKRPEVKAAYEEKQRIVKEKFPKLRTISWDFPHVELG